MKIKKIAAAVLAGTMVIAAMAVSAFAADANIEGQFDASVEGNFEEWQDCSGYKVSFDENSLATYTVDFGQTVKFAGNYVGLTTDIPFVEGMKANFVSIKLDGEEVAFTDAFLSGEGKTSDGGEGLRLTLTNQWNSDITTQPVDPAVWEKSFQTMEIQFYVGEYTADTPTGDSAATTALIFAAVAALAVAATVSVKKFAAER